MSDYKEKIKQGALCYFDDPEFMAAQAAQLEKLYDINHTQRVLLANGYTLKENHGHGYFALGLETEEAVSI